MKYCYFIIFTLSLLTIDQVATQHLALKDNKSNLDSKMGEFIQKNPLIFKFNRNFLSRLFLNKNHY